MPDDLGLLLVAMEPPPGLDEEFNDWYDTEHLPQRRALPGFLSGRRFVCVDGWPRYAALYDLTSAAALDSPGYRAVSGTNPTPWSRRILPRTVGRRRVVARQIAPGGETLTVQPISRLMIARLHQAGHAPDLIRSWRDTTVSGLLQARLFLVDDGEAWLVAAFDRPLPHAALIAPAAQLGSADVCNIYVPYHRLA